MKVESSLYLPSIYKNIDILKKTNGKQEVHAYSLDEDLNILEGWGKISSNNSWDYHNNYNDSEDVMWFSYEEYLNGNKKYSEKFFTTNLDEIKIIQKDLKDKWIKLLESEIERVREL